MRRSFTLIELLLVVGIIGVVSSVVIVAINPLRQTGSAVDAERQHNANQLMKAQFQYLIDRGRFAANQAVPEGLASAKQICRSSQSDTGCINVDTLISIYVPCIPYDGSETNAKFTGYRMYQLSGRIQIEPIYTGSGAARGGCERPLQPVAYWKFDETSIGAAAVDSSGNGQNGTAINFASPYGPSTNLPPTTFENPRSIYLDGENDHFRMTTTSVLNVNKTFTITAWIYLLPSSRSNSDILMRSDGGGQDELRLYLESDRTLGLLIDGLTSRTTSPVPLGQWVHVAALRDNANVRFYLSGVLAGTGTPGDSRTINFNDCNTLFIGIDVDVGCTGNPDSYFHGRIDDLRIYNVVLTDAQIANLAAGNP